MAAGPWQSIMKRIATTGIWPLHQLPADVIVGKNGAEALLMRIRPFSVRRCMQMLGSGLVPRTTTCQRPDFGGLLVHVVPFGHNSITGKTIQVIAGPKIHGAVDDESLY